MAAKLSFISDKDLVIKIQDSHTDKAFLKLEENITGKNIKEVFPFLTDKIESVFRDGRKRQVKNFRSTCVMGASLSCHVTLVPVRNKKGGVKEVSIVFDNISVECPLDKKLSDSEERMIEIGKTASSLAHGIRNPLNSIKGAVVYLREKFGHESTLLEFSTIINDEIDKLDTFISNFLSAAQGGMKSGPLVLDDILHRITAMIKPRAEIQNISIAKDLCSLPRINADSFQIEQALFNIVNNAIEAMPKGGVLEIKTSIKWEKNKDYAVIEISDTGKGIPQEKLRSIGQVRSKSGKNGRGFGIFLSREIIKSHNGKLFWESVSGKGTTFKIYLPITTGQGD
jgi:two-component system nitrogen regulation sensor histidine kinase GlnL